MTEGTSQSELALMKCCLCDAQNITTNDHLQYDGDG